MGFHTFHSFCSYHFRYISADIPFITTPENFSVDANVFIRYCPRQRIYTLIPGDRTMPRQPSKTFTDKELEIMRVIWERGEATAKAIQEALSGERHYNSVLTIIRVLERKGHLTHRAEGKAHVY